MNRIFLLIFCGLLIVSVLMFLRKRKRMPRKQQVIIFILYGCTIAFVVCLQLQYNQILPFGRLSLYVSPLKRWIEQLL
ncbi:hypothetical protein [Brevibacillus reuszeri]|uniref:Histidine kinase n=1 Tax=Brevibacillus reuszeri TaxID=54915 RepID=A0A0K9YVB4_9BACL|nr:hypothetical protein [Brevibacillus reuszeri]KNB72659.1 hypothetical protein ADS79_12480 [Brevibacillus reuszeri]MED1860644.1 hypothetical protein [Brevibacillus reuszeri]